MGMALGWSGDWLQQRLIWWFGNDGGIGGGTSTGGGGGGGAGGVGQNGGTSGTGNGGDGGAGKDYSITFGTIYGENGIFSGGGGGGTGGGGSAVAIGGSGGGGDGGLRANADSGTNHTGGGGGGSVYVEGWCVVVGYSHNSLRILTPNSLHTRLYSPRVPYVTVPDICYTHRYRYGYIWYTRRNYHQ